MKRIVLYLWKMLVLFLLLIAVCYFIVLCLANVGLMNFHYNLVIKYIVKTESIAGNQSLKREIIKTFVDSKENMIYYSHGLPRESNIHSGAVICYEHSALDARILNRYPDKIELGSHIIMRLNVNDNIASIKQAYYDYQWSFFTVMIVTAVCSLLLMLNLNQFNLAVYYTGAVVSNLLLISYYVFKIFGLGSHIMSWFDLHPALKVIFLNGLLIAVLLHLITLAIQCMTIRYARKKHNKGKDYLIYSNIVEHKINPSAVFYK